MGASIATRLSAAAGDDPVALAEADLIRAASDVSNVWHATGLHNSDGEMFDGAGVLFSSGCRLDPSYMKATSGRARARVREAMARVAPRGAERWRLVTLTMPTLPGVGLKLTLDVFKCAWSMLRKRKWWEDLVRAGVKGEEFTLGDDKRLKREGREWDATRDGYHVHAHVLALSQWIEWRRLGSEWTACLERAARQKGVCLTLATSHGRAVVDVRLVVQNKKNGARGVVSESGAVEEVCKYLTKGESWLKLPDEQLCEVVRVLRGRRMVDLLGELNRRRGSGAGRERLTAEQRQERAAARERARFLERERVTQAQWLADDPRAGSPLDSPGERDWREAPAAYLDTQKTIDGAEVFRDAGDGRITVKRVRRKSLRAIGVAMVEAGERVKWLELLAARVADVKSYRRAQLSWRYPYAEFSALDGGRWYGMRVSSASARN